MVVCAVCIYGVYGAQEQGADVSPWHDVALRNEDGTLNFVCEIAKDTSAKFEVATVCRLTFSA